MDILPAIKREERKLEKQLHKLQHQLKGAPSSCQSIGRLCGARSCRREKARPVGCWQSGDYQGS